MNNLKTLNYIFNSMECSDFHILFNKVQLNLCIIYRKSNSSMLTFICEFGSNMEQNVTTLSETIFISDLSIHIDNSDNLDTVVIESSGCYCTLWMTITLLICLNLTFILWSIFQEIPCITMCVWLYTLWVPPSNRLWLADMYSAMEEVLVIMTQLLHNAWYIIKLTTDTLNVSKLSG